MVKFRFYTVPLLPYSTEFLFDRILKIESNYNMTTLLEHPAVQALVNRMSLTDYHRLAELGLLPEKIELIDGVLINKKPKSPKHAYTVDYLLSIFRNIFQQNFIIRLEQPISIRNSEPEPDISISLQTILD